MDFTFKVLMSLSVQRPFTLKLKKRTTFTHHKDDTQKQELCIIPSAKVFSCTRAEMQVLEKTFTDLQRKNVKSCHHGDKAFTVHDPWEVRDEPVWERPVVLMSACSESWKMAEHLHSRLELNKCNIPESEKAATFYHLGDRKALQAEEFWLKPP